MLKVLRQDNLAELGSIADDEGGARCRKSNQPLILNVQEHADKQSQSYSPFGEANSLVQLVDKRSSSHSSAFDRNLSWLAVLDGQRSNV